MSAPVHLCERGLGALINGYGLIRASCFLFLPLVSYGTASSCSLLLDLASAPQTTLCSPSARLPSPPLQFCFPLSRIACSSDSVCCLDPHRPLFIHILLGCLLCGAPSVNCHLCILCLSCLYPLSSSSSSPCRQLGV